MRVLFLTDGIYPFQLGGMQRHSSILCREFARRGLNLEVVHCGGTDYSKEAFKSQFESDRIKEVHVVFPKTDSLPGHYIRESKKYSKNIFESVKARLNDFDLVYAQGLTAWYFLKMKKRGAAVPPVFANLHGLNMFQQAFGTRAKVENKLLTPISKYILLNADYVFSFGGKLDELLLDLGVGKKKILLQRNGVETAMIVDQPKRLGNSLKRLVFVGRNDKVKGFDMLLSAFKKVSAHKDIELSVIGPFDQNEFGFVEGVSYLGEIRDHGQLMSLIGEHDCLISSSYSEGLPLAILEAMSQGLAIIGTDVGATASLIDGNGLLVKQPTEKDLYKAIETVLELTSDELDHMKLKSLEKVNKEFVWSTIIDEQIKLIRTALSS